MVENYEVGISILAPPPHSSLALIAYREFSFFETGFLQHLSKKKYFERENLKQKFILLNFYTKKLASKF